MEHEEALARGSGDRGSTIPLASAPDDHVDGFTHPSAHPSERKTSCPPPTTTTTPSEIALNDNNNSSRSSSRNRSSRNRNKPLLEPPAEYREHEMVFVVGVGNLLSFNAGYINGACLSGLVSETGKRASVAGFTGAYTNSALYLAAGDLQGFGFLVAMILSMMFGSFVAGALTPNATKFRIEPMYGPTFLIGGVLLLVAAALAASEEKSDYFFFLAAAANGCQNGVSSTYSANLIRSTHLTGTTTDIGLFLGQVVRGNRKNFWKLLVLVSLAATFWCGGLVSYYITLNFTHFSLLFSSGLNFFIGIFIIVFLVHELHVTINAVLFGTWAWDKITFAVIAAHGDRDDDSVAAAAQSGDEAFHSEHLDRFFNHLTPNEDVDRINHDALHRDLRETGVVVSKKQAKILVRAADKSGDGHLSRDEFVTAVRKARSSIGRETSMPMAQPRAQPSITRRSRLIRRASI